MFADGINISTEERAKAALADYVSRRLRHKVSATEAWIMYDVYIVHDDLLIADLGNRQLLGWTHTTGWQPLSLIQWSNR